MDHSSSLTTEWRNHIYTSISKTKSFGYCAATMAGIENYPTISFKILDFPHQVNQSYSNCNDHISDPHQVI